MTDGYLPIVGKDRFHRFAFGAAELVGTSHAFVVACWLILAWALSGPLFHFSDTWQLVVNTATTVVTFLMVFLLQATQNRDSRAIHLKLDELIRSQRAARNVFAALQDASDEELARFEAEFRRLAERARERRGEAAATKGETS